MRKTDNFHPACSALVLLLMAFAATSVAAANPSNVYKPLAAALDEDDSSGFMGIRTEEILQRAGGIGSLPAAVLQDGTVCVTGGSNLLECRPLVKLPKTLVDKFETRFSFFDGLYDLDASGAPEIFIDYWPDRSDSNCPNQYKDQDSGCSAVVLFVYKKLGGSYREYARLYAPTMGYAPGAWFLTESTSRKAIFQTRYAGSSGDGLFYLDWKKRALELISDGFFMVESPIFEDIDGDGHAEIFIVARGYDRTAAQGAALLRWKNNRFQVWWPTWATPSPYVISAQMVKIGRDDRKEIVAVLDPEGESKRRELAVWKLTNDWTLVDKQEIREVQNQNSMMGLPQVSSVTPNAGGADVVLSYRDTVTCRYAQQKIRCPP